MNGVLHLSVPDGWWPEAYDGTNGWVIGDESVAESAAQEDSRDATALYQLLETKIVPLFYDRDRNGVPHGWLAYVKDAIRTDGEAIRRQDVRTRTRQGTTPVGL